LLESGEIHGDVAAHDKAAAWHVTAGPFDVAVGGTAFRMSWDPASETLDVRDVTDKVVVTGPYATRGVAVRRGEYLRVSMKLAKLEVSAAAPPPPAPPASSP
jgi:ferric-dicitrate binding protein FerR (iron transport regulator)